MAGRLGARMDVLFSFYVGNHPFLLARLRVGAGGGLEGSSMNELGGRMRVIAIGRAGSDGELEYPRAATRAARRRRRLPRRTIRGAPARAASRARRPHRVIAQALVGARPAQLAL